MSNVSTFVKGQIKSIQRGTISLGYGAVTNTATISSVNTSKSVLTALGASAVSGAAVEDSCGRLGLTNATTITADRGGTGATVILSWQLVEYY